MPFQANLVSIGDKLRFAFLCGMGIPINDRSKAKKDLMSNHYGKAAIAPVNFDFEASRRGGAVAQLNLTQKDVLGIVQSAFDDIASKDPALIAVMCDVLDEVSEGMLADALRLAIVGAGKRTCSCCN